MTPAPLILSQGIHQTYPSNMKIVNILNLCLYNDHQLNSTHFNKLNLSMKSGTRLLLYQCQWYSELITTGNILFNLKYINNISLLKYVITVKRSEASMAFPSSLPPSPTSWATINSQAKLPCDSKSFLEQWGVGQPWLTLMTCSMTKDSMSITYATTQ